MTNSTEAHDAVASPQPVSTKRWPTLSICLFALALIAVIWIGGLRQVAIERESLQRDIALDTANLAVALEQNVIRTASELDRILLFLRRSYERSNGSISWQTLIKEEYTINEQTVQIAVIDRSGMMITSTAMLFPPKPVDLSDREHFRFHATSGTDELFISKPLIGRASGRWSVQFARRFSHPDGGFGGVVVVSLDPEQISRAYQQLMLGRGGGLALVGTDGIIRSGTGRFKSMLGMGYREGRLIDTLETRSPGTRLSIEEFETGQMIVASRRLAGYPLEAVVVADGPQQSPQLRNKERTYLALAVTITALVLIAMLLAVMSQRRHESRLIHIARHDLLTGLPNRAMFRDSLETALSATRSDTGVALHLIDLDGFKLVNDTHGHPIGDKLLKAVANRLQDNLRSGDMVARLGGDEFAIIQPAPSCVADAEALAGRMCDVIARPYELDGTKITIGASIGIAFARLDASTATELTKAADIALYSAKLAGHGCHRRFEPSMDKAMRARRQTEDDLRIAITEGQLELFYQPIACLKTRRVVGYEALLRWRHPSRGLVPPMEFIPVAEDCGLIHPVGHWVIAKACLDAATWPDEITVAVNCSPLQFKSGQLAGSVKEALDRSGLPPERLEIEITESTLMQRDTMTAGQLAALKSLGIQISMDDFGTGYSSLSYLQSYPISCIKIDRSFTQALGTSDGADAIVRAIIALADSLGMRTIAEGVETEEQVELLRALGCNEIQGYLLGKPAPLSQISMLSLPPPRPAAAQEAA